MAQGTSYSCDCCGARIDDNHSPFVVYVVTGPVPLHTATKAGPVAGADYALSPSVRAMLAGRVARLELCSTCYAWDRGEDLVSGPAEQPVVVVKHAEHQARDTFAAAAQAYHEQQAAARAAQQAAEAQARAEAEQAKLAAAASKALPPGDDSGAVPDSAAPSSSPEPGAA